MKEYKPTILVADDNPDNLGVLNKVLSEQNYKVRTAQNGKLALESVKLSAPDLILLDVHMPEMDGYDFCERLKEIDDFKHIPVIFVSALGESFNKVKAFDKGAVDYITKPIDQREVIARIQTHLKIQQLQNDLEQQNQVLEQRVSERTQELEELNAKLCQLDESKSDFIRLISHELKTPLVGVGIIEEVIQNNISDPDELQEFYEMFCDSYRKLLKIVDHSVTLTKLDTILHNEIHEECELFYLIHSEIEKLNACKSHKKVKIEYPKEHASLFVKGSSLYMEKAVHALFDIACRFTKNDKSISVQIMDQEKQCVLIIKTQGWTVPAHLKGSFFDVFGVNETIIPGGEIGLSPAVASQIIQMCDGYLQIDNNGDEGIVLTAMMEKSLASDKAAVTV